MTNILIIHHNDDDGIAAAGVAGYFNKMGSYLKADDTNIDFMKTDYIQSLSESIDSFGYDINSYNKILLLDYSISTSENVSFILDISNKADVIWIDHHKSSIDSIKLYPKLLDIKGLRIIGISGVLLTWIWYFIGGLPEQYRTKLNEYNNTSQSFSIIDVDDIIKQLKVPKTISAIHYYDIWDHRNPKTTLFHLGYSLTHPIEIYKVIESQYVDYSTYDGAVSDGSVIQKYVDEENSEHCIECGFNMHIHDNLNNRIYTVFALNTNRTTSLTFGTNMDKYDICMPFYYNGKKNAWSYSLYTNKDNVDCSYIAKVLGGGGHKKAAGFSLNRCIVDTNDRNIEI